MYRVKRLTKKVAKVQQRTVGLWMDGWMDEWMDGWMERYIDGWIDRQIDR
jgi:hypothetical protein